MGTHCQVTQSIIMETKILIKIDDVVILPLTVFSVTLSGWGSWGKWASCGWGALMYSTTGLVSTSSLLHNQNDQMKRTKKKNLEKCFVKFRSTFHRMWIFWIAKRKTKKKNLSPDNFLPAAVWIIFLNFMFQWNFLLFVFVTTLLVRSKSLWETSWSCKYLMECKTFDGKQKLRWRSQLTGK